MTTGKENRHVVTIVCGDCNNDTRGFEEIPTHCEGCKAPFFREAIPRDHDDDVASLRQEVSDLRDEILRLASRLDSKQAAERKGRALAPADCPFCGCNEVELTDDTSGAYIECIYCDARGPSVRSGSVAIEAWNARAKP